MSLAERLARFESAPVVDCLINDEFEERGLASVFIGRRSASGELAFAVFLVDTYCMGVKDCFGEVPVSRLPETPRKIQKTRRPPH